MKKIILCVIVLFVCGFANAQELKNRGFKAGAHIGLPMGTVRDSYAMNVGLDLSYMWKVHEKIQVGIMSGYSAYLGKSELVTYGDDFTYEFENEDEQYIPIAGTISYDFTKNFFVGADLGLAALIAPFASNGFESGFLYQPKFGYKTTKIEAYFGYKGVSASYVKFSSLNIGFELKF